MIVTDIFLRLSDDVFSEDCHLEENLGDRLEEFVLSLDDQELATMAKQLKELAGLRSSERGRILDEVGFAWSFNDEAEFFAKLATAFQFE